MHIESMMWALMMLDYVGFDDVVFVMLSVCRI